MTEAAVRVRLEAARILVGAREVSPAIDQILETVCVNFRWNWGGYWEVRGASNYLSLSNSYFSKGGDLKAFETVSRHLKLARDEDLPGSVWASKAGRTITDMADARSFPRAEAAKKMLFRGALAIPVMHNEVFWGVMEFFSWTPIEERNPQYAAMDYVGEVTGLFICRCVEEETKRRASKKP